MPDDGRLWRLFTQDEAMDKRRKELMKEAEERKAEAAALKEQERAERGDDDEEEEEEVRHAAEFSLPLYISGLAACISASPTRVLRVPLSYLRVPQKHHYPVIGIFWSCKFFETISVYSRTFLRVFVVLLIQST